MSKNKKKEPWGSWLKPHVATVTPPPVRPRMLVIVPPSDWPLEKQRLFGAIEQGLMQIREFAHLSVLPPGCLKVITR